MPLAVTVLPVLTFLLAKLSELALKSRPSPLTFEAIVLVRKLAVALPS